jgi:hypothetical protein
MSNIVTTAPTINYVSSSDITKTNSENGNLGYLRYQIFFNETVATNGNIIMFEYMMQGVDNDEYSPENTDYGFVSVDTAIQTGVINQYVLAIPAPEQTYGAASGLTIQFRVYTGDKSTQEVIATEWSLPLNVYYPPVEPNINPTETLAYAYYDPNSDNTNADLFVFFDSSNNHYYYDSMKFIVCFYYKDISGDTIWRVSDPLPALAVAGSANLMVVTVTNIEPVYADAFLYLNMHAVYDWNVNGDHYYSVSSASADLIAIEAINASSPNITSVVYHVYTTDEQTMTVNWNAPENDTVPFFEVSYYQLFYNINGEGFVQYMMEDLSRNILSRTVDVDSLGMDCDDSIVFRVNAITINNQNTPSNLSPSTNIFKYAGPVSGLVVYDTFVNENNTVNLTVHFNQVAYSGCGNPIQYVISFDTEDANNLLVPYDSEAETYDISYVELSINQVGNVTVYLQTQDTNSSDLMNGESVTAPYIANNLVLEPVVYNVYTSGNQTMDLSWNNVVFDMVGWDLSYYLVEVKIGTDISAPWSTVYTGTDTVATYVVSLAAVSQLLTFRVTANVVNDYAPSNIVSYDIVSNDQSINTFSYAGPVSDLEVINTLVNEDDSINLSVNFNQVEYVGLGQPIKYVININDVVAFDVSYADVVSYNISYVNLDISQVGNVTVFLQTQDTNSSDLMNGESVTAPYIANNLVLEPVVYNVYTSGNQTMDLSWNNVVFDMVGWDLSYYLVEVKIGTDNSAPWSTVYTGTDTVATYVVSLAAETEELTFKVTATVFNGSVSYDIISNEQSKYTFSYAGPVSDLEVINTLVNEDDSINLSVNFNQVEYVGLGQPIKYVININDVVAFDVSYADVVSYDISYVNLDISQVGNVTVFLQTQDTNSSDLMNGESVTAPYIANNLVLNELYYEVYVNEVQEIDLSWNNVVFDMVGWDLSYYLVEVKIGTDNSAPWSVVYTGTNTVATYVVSLAEVSQLLTFRVTANVVSGSVAYDIVSNDQSINTFSYAGPVSNAILNWAVANTNNTTMDIFCRFQNPLPLESGVNDGIDEFLITLYDESENVIVDPGHNPIIKSYISDDAHIYDVYFNNVPYSHTGSVIIETFVQDTNGGGSISSTMSEFVLNYVATEVPTYIDLSYDAINNVFNGTIVSHDTLKLTGQLIYRDQNSTPNKSLTKLPVSTDNTTNGFQIANPPIDNLDGTLSYPFVLTFASFQGLSSQNDWSLSVANTAGVGTLIDLGRL